MNARQTAFYRQAQSDWTVFRHFHPGGWRWWKHMRRLWCGVVGVRPFNFPVCHELHYLQMSTEKLAKAYFKTETRASHAAFRSFLAALPSNPKAIYPLQFADLAGLTRWQGSVKPLVDAIEDLAPAIANKKQLHTNPEYPWPKTNPVLAPADYAFTTEVFNRLDVQARSGEPPFLIVMDRMVDTMQTTAWHL